MRLFFGLAGVVMGAGLLALTVAQARRGLRQLRELHHLVSLVQGTHPTTTVQRFTVSALPADDLNRRHFELYVERRDRGRWVVRDGWENFLTKDGEWVTKWDNPDWEDTRFELGVALALAGLHAQLIVVHGMTVEDALARRAVRMAKD